MTIDEIETLRQRGLILECEIAEREGDVIVAVNVTTRARRMIGKASELRLNERKLILG